MQAALHGVFEFAHVARPGVFEQRPPGVFAKPGEQFPAQFGAHLHGEMLRQKERVAVAMAQRRHVHHVKAEPVQKVGAKRPGRGQGAQIGVGRPDHAQVGAQGLVAADALEFAVFDKTQQFFLHARRHRANFIQQQRAPVRAFEAADVAAGGAGKRPGFVPEQLALEQGFGNRRAVELDKRAAPARRQKVQALGGQFFAGAALAENQHRALDGGQTREVVEGFAQGQRLAEHGIGLFLHGLNILISGVYC